MLEQYILVDGEPVLEPDSRKAYEWWADIRNRRVGRTEVGNAIVYTSFLGADHRFTGDGPPILFETMIRFVGLKEGDPVGWDDQQWRYSTLAEAQAGHEQVVEWVRRGMLPDGEP